MIPVATTSETSSTHQTHARQSPTVEPPRNHEIPLLLYRGSPHGLHLRYVQVSRICWYTVDMKWIGTCISLVFSPTTDTVLPAGILPDLTGEFSVGLMIQNSRDICRLPCPSMTAKLSLHSKCRRIPTH